MIIAVDFDGTIVEHKYPEIGRELPFAIETLKKLQQERHRLILWSAREGKLLQEAVDFCRERGLEFYAVNSNYAEETLESNHYSRKLKADLFIDDRNLGGLPDAECIVGKVGESVPMRKAVTAGRRKMCPQRGAGRRLECFLVRWR